MLSAMEERTIRTPIRRRISALGLAVVLLMPASTTFAQDAPAAPAGQWERHGHADITFTGADDSGAFQGNVDSSTDPELLDVGAVSLTMQPYDMALLQQGGTQLTLCGEDSADLAPTMDIVEACGA
jgi:hypothetical protein